MRWLPINIKNSPHTIIELMMSQRPSANDISSWEGVPGRTIYFGGSVDQSDPSGASWKG